MLKGEHIGLVGANGEGKSTFLNIITGKLSPDSGRVEWCKHITTGYLDQYSTLEKGKTIRDVTELSGGQRAKVLLAKLLLENPMILVLDEPTNHLDVMAKEELKKAVSEFRGTVLLVSHEPEFYEGVVDKVINLENVSNKCV